MFPAAGRERGRRPETADLDIHRQPEADQPPVLPRGVALGDQTLPVGFLQREVERFLIVAGIVDGSHLRLVRELVRTDEVAPPELGGIHLQFVRQHVHGALDEVGRLGAAGAAVGVGGCLVGEDLRQRRANGRNVVGAVGHQHGERRNGRRQQHVVGADVGNQPELQPEHFPVTLRCDVHVADDVAAMGRGDEGFGSILDPLDREAERPSRPRPPRTPRRRC